MGDFFEIREVGVEEGGADGEEVAVAWIVDFDDAPWVGAGTDLFAVDLFKSSCQ